jgi:preprotein translocase subunit SecG
MLTYILYGLFFVSCLILVAAVLLQPGKADAGALFTSSISSTAFGPRGTQSVLSKIAIGSATVFFLSALLLSMPALTGSGSVLQTQRGSANDSSMGSTDANSNTSSNANVSTDLNSNSNAEANANSSAPAKNEEAANTSSSAANSAAPDSGANTSASSEANK